MNWVDVAILITLAWFSYAAFHAGFIREAITILGAIFAVALAGLFYENLSQDVDVAVNDVETSKIIAFAVIFGSVVLASQLLALFLKQAASLLMLGLFDALGGAFVGLIKGFIFVEIALIFGITFVSLGVEGSIENSAFAPFFLDFLPVLKAILPTEFKDAIDSF
ncbi:MAG TPA: CvpA family protein [Dehalococcoidia bacterium]|nr:CvpA family protein [Dehalococcoidia bacterium]